MIETRSLYPFRNKMRNYDEEKGLILELNNYIYDFLNTSRAFYVRHDFEKKIWSILLMRPMQEKINTPTNFIFSVLHDIYNKNDLSNLYAYIELLYDSVYRLSKTNISETLTRVFSNLPREFETGINDIFLRYNTGLTLSLGFIIRGLNGVTKREIETALEENDTASKNIRSALQSISIRGQENADLCIREATCAIEFIIRTRLNVKQLSDGTKILSNGGIIGMKQYIHPALLKSLENYYGYSSDSVRHAATKPISIDEAHLALALSAAWVNFLRKTLPEPTVDENQ